MHRIHCNPFVSVSFEMLFSRKTPQLKQISMFTIICFKNLSSIRTSYVAHFRKRKNEATTNVLSKQVPIILTLLACFSILISLKNIKTVLKIMDLSNYQFEYMSNKIESYKSNIF